MAMNKSDNHVQASMTYGEAMGLFEKFDGIANYIEKLAKEPKNFLKRFKVLATLKIARNAYTLQKMNVECAIDRGMSNETLDRGGAAAINMLLDTAIDAFNSCSKMLKCSI